jgi:hypothetical protein
MKISMKYVPSRMQDSSEKIKNAEDSHDTIMEAYMQVSPSGQDFALGVVYVKQQVMCPVRRNIRGRVSGPP